MENFAKAIRDAFEVDKFQTNTRLENIISCNAKLTKTLFIKVYPTIDK